MAPHLPTQPEVMHRQDPKSHADSLKQLDEQPDETKNIPILAQPRVWPHPRREEAERFAAYNADSFHAALKGLRVCFYVDKPSKRGEIPKNTDWHVVLGGLPMEEAAEALSKDRNQQLKGPPKDPNWQQKQREQQEKQEVHDNKPKQHQSSDDNKGAKKNPPLPTDIFRTVAKHIVAGLDGDINNFERVNQGAHGLVAESVHKEEAFKKVELHYVPVHVPDKNHTVSTWVLAISDRFDHPSYHGRTDDIESYIKQIHELTICMPEETFEGWRFVETLEYLFSVMFAPGKKEEHREKTIILNADHWMPFQFQEVLSTFDVAPVEAPIELLSYQFANGQSQRDKWSNRVKEQTETERSAWLKRLGLFYLPDLVLRLQARCNKKHNHSFTLGLCGERIVPGGSDTQGEQFNNLLQKGSTLHDNLERLHHLVIQQNPNVRELADSYLKRMVDVFKKSNSLGPSVQKLLMFAHMDMADRYISSGNCASCLQESHIHCLIFYRPVLQKDQEVISYEGRGHESGKRGRGSAAYSGRKYDPTLRTNDLKSGRPCLKTFVKTLKDTESDSKNSAKSFNRDAKIYVAIQQNNDSRPHEEHPWPRERVVTDVDWYSLNKTV